MKVTIEQSKNSIIMDEVVLQELEKGIDDMEAERELPIEEAFEKITQLRNDGRDIEK